MLALGICSTRFPVTLATLARSAEVFGVERFFSLGTRYRGRTSTRPGMRVEHFDSVFEMKTALRGLVIVGVEVDKRSRPLLNFVHPPNAAYLVGSDDAGLGDAERLACDVIVQIGDGTGVLNAAVAGSVVLWDRLSKLAR